MPKEEITDIHRILVMFGSQSDEKVYEEILSDLAHHGVEFDLKIASAHRTPELVEQILEEKEYDIIIAGAGLSAALPGVIASKTPKPVIGVPVKSNYQGLDALLSIMQMPPGIAVMGVGVENTKAAAINALKMLTQHEYINIIGDSELKPIKRCEDMMVQFDQEFKFSDKIENDAINIKFVQLGESVEESEALVIYCPLTDEDTAQAALNLLSMTSHGLWVGLNRGDNAALSALQIINLDGRHNETFDYYRKSLKKKVLEGFKNAAKGSDTRTD